MILGRETPENDGLPFWWWLITPFSV
jgi:hypothetical protein